MDRQALNVKAYILIQAEVQQNIFTNDKRLS